MLNWYVQLFQILFLIGSFKSYYVGNNDETNHISFVPSNLTDHFFSAIITTAPSSLATTHSTITATAGPLLTTTTPVTSTTCTIIHFISILLPAATTSSTTSLIGIIKIIICIVRTAAPFAASVVSVYFFNAVRCLWNILKFNYISELNYF